MKNSIEVLLKGTIWTIGVFGLSQVIRLITNVMLTRLLAPNLFGIMLIVYALRTGIELISDIGIGQNIIYSNNAFKPEFYNTAWSLQIIRSVILWLAFCAAAGPVAQFYNSPSLVLILPIAGTGILFAGFTSVSRSLLQKRMQFAKLNTFELIMITVSSAAYVLLVYLIPTIWGLAIGGLFYPAGYMIGSYFLLTDMEHKFYMSRRFSWEILHFGKWIFISSIAYFLSVNFDRLYLAKVVPLELLGVYGIARSISDLLAALVARLGNNVLFPFIASHSETPREELRERLSSVRFRFLFLVALGSSILVVTSDLLVKILYDERYHAASWMLPILITGSWFSIVANINESTLLGLGRPSYSSFSNSVKFIFLLFCLPISIKTDGLLGGVMVVAVVDMCRYIPILIGQIRERFSFSAQDIRVTLAMFSMIVLLEWLRFSLGFGTSLDSFPIKEFRM